MRQGPTRAPFGIQQPGPAPVSVPMSVSVSSVSSPGIPPMMAGADQPLSHKPTQHSSLARSVALAGCIGSQMGKKEGRTKRKGGTAKKRERARERTTRRNEQRGKEEQQRKEQRQKKEQKKKSKNLLTFGCRFALGWGEPPPHSGEPFHHSGRECVGKVA